MHIGLRGIGDQKGHHQAVCKGAAGTDGHQGIHVGIAVEEGLEASQEEVSPAVEDGNSQDQLQNGEIHRMGMHGKNVRQGQGRQAEGQHLAHGDVQQRHRECGSDDQLRLLLPQGRRFSILCALGRSRGRMILVQGCAEARLFHLGHDLLRLYLAFVIADGHNAGGEVHVAALHPRQTAGHPLHRCAARRAVHPRDVIFFLAHGKIPFPSRPSFF